MRHGSARAGRRRVTLAGLLPAALLAGILGASAPSGPAAAATPAPRVLGAGTYTFTYCVDQGVPLAMTVFEPAAAGARHPGVLQVHGGGWVRGKRMTSLADSSVVRQLVAAGFVVASIDYRLAPRFPWPAQMQDVACAVRFLRSRAFRLRLDPGRIGAWGSSAGGLLVSLLGTAPDLGPWAPAGNPKESAAVQAVVDEFGPEDLAASGWGPYLKKVVHTVFGALPGLAIPVLLQASPLYHVAPGDPPFLVAHGLADQLVPVSQAEDFARRLRANAVPVDLILVRHGRHGLSTPGESPSARQLGHDIVAFLERRLGH